MLTVQTILQEARSLLAAAFESRLDQVILYGSFARGDQTAESDLDLMVVLHGPVRLGTDMETAIHALFERQMQWGVPIDLALVSHEAWNSAQWGLYRHARAEGLAA